MQYMPEHPRVLSSNGRYDAFPVLASNGTQLLALWRSAKPGGHATDDNASTVASVAAVGVGAPQWSSPATTTGLPRPTSATAVAWDPQAERWVILALNRASGALAASLWTSSDGLAWENLRATVPAAASWWFPSDLRIDGEAWVAAGYGELIGRKGWLPLTMVSLDQGATWTPATAPAGLPERSGWAEPQIVKRRNDWIMLIRCDSDWSIHTATSSDGLAWAYNGVAWDEASGSPELEVAPNGALVALFRNRPLVSNTHGTWGYATSSDGTSWNVHREWVTGGYMMYGGLAPCGDSLACIYATEDDPSKLWATSSIFTAEFVLREPRPITPASELRPAQVWTAPAWRYLAYRLTGDGSQQLIHPDLPLSGVSIDRVLSGTNGFKATIPYEVVALEGADRAPVLTPWSTLIVAEASGVIRGCFIVTKTPEQGQSLSIEADGFTGYAKGMPAPGEVQRTDYDSLEAFREIWAAVQSQPAANLGLIIEGSTSSGIYLGRMPVDKWKQVKDGDKQTVWPIGTPFRYTWQVSAAVPAKTVKTTKIVNHKRVATTKTTAAKPAKMEADWYGECSRTYPTPIPAGSTVILRHTATGALSRDTAAKGLPAGYEVFGIIEKKKPKTDSEGATLEPWTLNWFTDTDLGSKLETVCADGGFDFWEDHTWDGENIRHSVRVAAPAAGRVRDDLRFVVGENIIQEPQLEHSGENFASEVNVLGAGEGRAMIRGTWKATTQTRLRRVKTVTDKTIQTASEADARAAREAQTALGEVSVTSIVVIDHPNAPLWSWSLGDTITVQGSGSGWSGGMSKKMRIVGESINPAASTSTLTLSSGERTTT